MTACECQLLVSNELPQYVKPCTQGKSIQTSLVEAPTLWDGEPWCS